MTYYIELQGKVLDALNEADINVNTLRRKYHSLVPISILEKACKLNMKDKLCNINLQYIWFCLNTMRRITVPSLRATPVWLK